MDNIFGLGNETIGLGSEEFQIYNIEDHAVPIFKLQYWQFVCLICYYSVCAIIAIFGEALIIFYIARHAPKNRPLNDPYRLGRFSCFFQLFNLCTSFF